MDIAVLDPFVTRLFFPSSSTVRVENPVTGRYILPCLTLHRRKENRWDCGQERCSASLSPW